MIGSRCASSESSILTTSGFASVSFGLDLNRLLTIISHHLISRRLKLGTLLLTVKAIHLHFLRIHVTRIIRKLLSGNIRINIFGSVVD